MGAQTDMTGNFLKVEGLRSQGVFGVYDMVGRIRSGSTSRDGTGPSTVKPAGSVIFFGEQDNLTAA